MQVTPTMLGALGGLYLFIWLLMVVGGIIGYVVLLMSAWRAMRAHEEISTTLKEIRGQLSERSRTE